LNTWLSFGSAQPSKVAQFSAGANNHFIIAGGQHMSFAQRGLI